MSDAPNPQLVVGWTVQNQGADGALDLVASQGGGPGGGPDGLAGEPAANVPNSTASTVAGIVADHNTLLAALQAAGLMAA